MRRVCCVVDCKAESMPGRRLSFHKFPSNEEMYKKWVNVVLGTVNPSSMVCALHFKPEDFTTHSANLTQHLKPDAVPSIFRARPLRTRPSLKAARNTKTVKSSKANYVKDDHVMDGYDTDYDSGDTDYVRYRDKEGYNTNSSDEDLYTKKNKLMTNGSGCKCCLGGNKLKPMWQENGTNVRRDYGSMLIECFALPWNKPEDPKFSPDLICESCIVRLRDAVSFKKEVLASEQLLSTQLEVDLVKPNQEHDDEDTQFDVQTEYLHYEYLEDNLDNEEDGYEDARDDARDDCDKFTEDEDSIHNKDDDASLASNKDETTYRRYPVRERETVKRKPSTDSLKVAAVAGRGASQGAAVKRFKGPGGNPFNVTKKSDEQYKMQTDVKVVNKKIKGHLEDILRYSNATPIGDHTTNGFRCSFCRDRYDSPKNLKHHTLDKHAENVIIHTAEDHVKLDITGLKCLDCYANVDSIHDFINHMQIEHRMHMRKGMHYPIVPFKFDSDVMKCALCHKTFKCFDSLNNHMSVHLQNYEKVDPSQQEQELGGNDGEGEKPEDSAGRLEKLEQVPERPGKIKLEKIKVSKLKCQACGWTFVNRTALVLHQNKYHSDLAVKCQYCDSKFIGTNDLTRHVMVKHNIKKS